MMLSKMFSDSFEEQCYALAHGLEHWLTIFDRKLAEDDVPVRDRPLHAAALLCRKGCLQVELGDEIADITKPHEHLASGWFRALYAAVEYWYVSRFGESAILHHSKRCLEGVILIRGAPFLLHIKAQRSVVEVKGETAWIYFEDCVGPDECVLDWIVDGPDLAESDKYVRAEVLSIAHEVATMLRFIRYRSGLADVGEDVGARELCEACFTYAEQAARCIASGDKDKRGMAWFDLQMANETALKAVIRRSTGCQNYIHSLPDLLADAGKCGVSVNADTLKNWPAFKEISEWRYGQGDPGRSDYLFEAYMITLRLVRACMAAIPPHFQPGFGVLVRYAPWKFRLNDGNG